MQSSAAGGKRLYQFYSTKKFEGQFSKSLKKKQPLRVGGLFCVWKVLLKLDYAETSFVSVGSVSFAMYSILILIMPLGHDWDVTVVNADGFEDWADRFQHFTVLGSKLQVTH